MSRTVRPSRPATPKRPGSSDPEQLVNQRLVALEAEIPPKGKIKHPSPAVHEPTAVHSTQPQDPKVVEAERDSEEPEQRNVGDQQPHEDGDVLDERDKEKNCCTDRGTGQRPPDTEPSIVHTCILCRATLSVQPRAQEVSGGRLLLHSRGPVADDLLARLRAGKADLIRWATTPQPSATVKVWTGEDGRLRSGPLLDRDGREVRR